MSDLIDRDEAIKRINRQRVVDKSVARRILYTIPTAKQKVGRWVDDGTKLGFCCSECGSAFDDYFYGDLSDVSMCKVPKFCPNCGAKMEGQDG